MANVKEVFSPAGSSTALTFTLNSLASSATVGRESTVVDNSANLFMDALVTVTISYPNSVPANDKLIYVYAHGSIDGTVYSEGLTGADAGYTINSPSALRVIGVIPGIQNTTKTFGPFPVAPAFGGLLPYKWGLVVVNFSGQTLAASANTAQFVGMYATVV